MLPFLPKAKKLASAIVERRKAPDMPEEPGNESGEVHPLLVDASQDVLKALETKNPQELAQALQHFFQISDLLPHSEGPHEDE